ncbi:MAG: DegT/DnrJ/EryC1/StrS family aminotransferase [Candidatus Delongbacteria bacterium]
MKVPFADLTGAFDYIYPEIMEKLEFLIKNTQFIGGEEVSSFESEFADYSGTKYCVGCANGTDAIIIALKTLNIQPGDTVVVPANTFIATSEAVTAVGGKVAFVDIEKEYYTVDPVKLEEYIVNNQDKRITAVIPVHLYGQMANMKEIKKIADKYGLKIIEDSSQAHGSEAEGITPGTYGDIATYSFYPGKNLGAFGDAGSLNTNDGELYKKAKMLVNHGRWKEKYLHDIEGYNMRLDTIQAAVLRIKLKHLNNAIDMRRKNAELYNAELAKYGIKTPQVREKYKHAYHLYVIEQENRDSVLEKLKEHNISCGIHYPVILPLQPAYKYLGHKAGDFPVSETAATKILSLPFWPEMSAEQIEYVSSEFK